MSFSQHTKSLATACLLVFLWWCESNPYSPEVEDVSSQAPIEREGSQSSSGDGDSEPEPITNQATLALLASAQAADANSEHGSAISYLERAIRLEPRNAELWIALTSQYLKNHEVANAKQHARKAIALAANSKVLTRKAWLVFADVREAEGATQEAKSLRRRWRNAEG